MGNAVRMMKYDRAANEANAIPALTMAGESLSWFRLDDGVMGGRSETRHGSDQGALHFTGTINTSGGGFASIRTPIPENWLDTASTGTTCAAGLKVRMRGDGKTYKLIMSAGGTSGGPFAKNPSWQADLPTKKIEEGADEWEEVVVPFSALLPSWGGRRSSRPSDDEKSGHKFDAAEMKELGFMLSLYRADGSKNPVETFGEGIFPFSLHIQSVEPVDSVK